MKKPHFLWLAALVFLRPAFAQPEPAEPAAILELGAAAGWNLLDGAGSVGPNLAVEVTPIENWLELEAGITPLLRVHHAPEWNTDLLFKKPWTLSRKMEVMLGAGPEWVHTREPGAPGNAIAAEVVLDLMFWPSGRHRFGWYVEPGYDYRFARGHERSGGLSAGLLIGIR